MNILNVKICRPNQAILCGGVDCQMCFDKSIASHENSKYWSDANHISPRRVFKNSNTKYFFNCTCGHQISQTPNKVNQNVWCPYCASKKLCNDANCEYCFNKSFASVNRSTFWSIQNTLSPRFMFKGSDKYVYFNCEAGHEFKSRLGNITYNNRWCPHCRHKTEEKLFNAFRDLGYDIRRQVRYSWCTNENTNIQLPFDFVIEEYKLIIELDGSQHFKQIMNWKSPELQQTIDKYKMMCANINDYTVVRIPQIDVFCDTYDWINSIESNIFQHDLPCCIYIAINDIYNNHVFTTID